MAKMIMDLQDKVRLLRAIYTIFDEFIEGYDLACRKQCATCCTRNVTMTTLEGIVLSQHLAASRPSGDWLETIRTATQGSRLLPRMTINCMAALCAADDELPEAPPMSNTEACPLLADGNCSAYDARPFGCRAMVSRTVCGHQTEADMPDFVLTVNNLMMQYIEALDNPGLFGNLIDIVLWLADDSHAEIYARQEALSGMSTLLVNQPISVLMIPPEHRARIQPLMQAMAQAEANQRSG